MRFVRNNVRGGSWLALAALAINLALSFGHLHLQQNMRDMAGKLAVSASLTNPAGDDSGNRADDLCSICLATAAIGSAVASSAPSLPVDFTAVAIDLGSAPQLFVSSSRHAAFWSRGPPLT